MRESEYLNDLSAGIQRVRGNGRDDDKSRLALRFGDAAAQPPDDGKAVLVRGILQVGSITLISGRPKSGKSFLATDLLRSVADVARMLWMGQPILAHGPVLYVACEGHGGFWKRLRAGGPVPDNFVLATGRPMLIASDDNGRAYAPHPDDILVAIEAVKARLGRPPIAIAIDTVFRSFGGGNVNASDHMNAYIAAATQLADLGIAIVLVHHETKAGNTPAGSISLMGAADILIRTEKLSDGTTRSWCVEDAKDDAVTEPRSFSLDPVDVGLDRAGEPASSCKIVDLGAGVDASDLTRKRGRPPSETSEGGIFANAVYHEICEVLADPAEGHDIAFHPQAQPIRAISRPRLRETINRAGILDPIADTDDEKDRRRAIKNNDRKVNRALTRLKTQHKVALNDQWVGLLQ